MTKKYILFFLFFAHNIVTMMPYLSQKPLIPPIKTNTFFLRFKKNKKNSKKLKQKISISHKTYHKKIKKEKNFLMIGKKLKIKSKNRKRSKKKLKKKIIEEKQKKRKITIVIPRTPISPKTP